MREGTVNLGGPPAEKDESEDEDRENPLMQKQENVSETWDNRTEAETGEMSNRAIVSKV